MDELGYCIGRCVNKKDFVENDYSVCGDLMCYNMAIKFRCCVKCECNILRYIMTDNVVEVAINNIRTKSI